MIQQRPGLEKIPQVEAFCEPRVDRREQVSGGGALALSFPEAGEARRGSQFP